VHYDPRTHEGREPQRKPDKIINRLWVHACAHVLHPCLSGETCRDRHPGNRLTDAANGICAQRRARGFATTGKDDPLWTISFRPAWMPVP
jgi:hypothetical protein